MKLIKFFFFLFFTQIFYCCQKDESGNDNELVKIITNKTIYSQSESVNVDIKNISNDTILMHFHCCGDKYSGIEIIEKIDNDHWVSKDTFYICSARLMSEYWGKIAPNNIISDEIILKGPGKYKLNSLFVINSDTANFFSNEFIVE